MATTVVLDLSVFCHQLYHKLNAVTDINLVKPKWFTDPSLITAKLEAVELEIAKAKLKNNLELASRLSVAEYDLRMARNTVGMVNAQLAYLMSLDWLGDRKPTDATTIILASDTKPYWRLDYLKRPSVFLPVLEYQVENKLCLKGQKAKLKKADRLKELLELNAPALTASEEEWVEYQANVNERSALIEELQIAYKAGRKFPESGFTKLKQGIYDIVDGQCWNRIAVKNYEADDIAAAVVALNNAKADPDRVLLCTIDSDWCGLINDHTAWVDIGGFTPRVRDSLETLNSWRTKKKERPLASPRDMWTAKVREGDKSDNLPPGSPIEVIDLLNPPTEYRLWENDYFLSRLDQCKPQPVRSGLAALDYLQNFGCSLAVTPL